MFSVAGLAALGPGKLLPIAAGVCAFGDAWVSGIWKREGSKAFLNIPPAGWGIVILWLPVVGVPVYFWYRNKLKSRTATNAWWYLTLALGTVAIFPALIFLFAVVTQGLGGAEVER